jgi:hypothetical protein
MEMQVVGVRDGSGRIAAIGLDPVLVVFERTGARRGENAAKQVVLTMELKRRPEDTTLTNVVFGFGPVTPGTCRLGSAAPPVANLNCEMLKPQLPALVALAAPVPPTRGQPAPTPDLGRFGATISLTEVQDGGDLNRAIAAALREEANREAIAKPISDYGLDRLDRLVRDLLNMPKPPAPG